MAFKEKKKPHKEDDAGEEIIHRFKAHPVLFIGTVLVLVLVIVAFVLVPALVPEVGGPEADLNFGYYNKVPINYVRDNYFARVQTALAQESQSRIDESNYQTLVYQIWREAFEETVVHMGILDEMKTAGYTPPTAEVDREVALLPQFQENGGFSAVKYRQLDNAQRMALWRQVQESMTIEQYLADMTGLAVSSKEAPFVSAMAGPKRAFDLAAFPFSSYPDAEVAAYGEAHPELFKTTHYSIITFTSSEREARQVLDAVNNGTSTFEEAAQSNSRDSYADKGGDMGLRMAYELSADVPDQAEREAVLALGPGELSDLVKTPTGWAFFRAEEAARPADPGDPASLEKIRTYLLSFERGRIEDYLIAKANNFISEVKEAGFDEACAREEITKKSFGPLPVNYGDVPLFYPVSYFGVTELAQAGSNGNFWRVGFSTPLNSPSTPLVLGDNVLVLYPTEEIPADENEKSNIEAYYTYIMSDFTNQVLRSFFLTNPKLEDKFFDAFFKYLWSPNG